MTKASTTATIAALGLSAAALATTAQAQTSAPNSAPGTVDCTNNPGLTGRIPQMTFFRIASTPTGPVAKIRIAGAPADTDWPLAATTKWLNDAACTKTSNNPLAAFQTMNLAGDIREIHKAQGALLAAQAQPGAVGNDGAPVPPQPQNYPPQAQQAYPQGQAALPPPPPPPPVHRFGFSSPFTTSHFEGQIGTSILRDPQGNAQIIQISYDRTLLNYDKTTDTAQVVKAPKTIGMLANQQEGFIKKFFAEICDTNPPKAFSLKDGNTLAEVTIRSNTPGAAEVAQLCGPKRGIIDGALAQSPVEIQPAAPR